MTRQEAIALGLLTIKDRAPQEVENRRDEVKQRSDRAVHHTLPQEIRTQNRDQSWFAEREVHAQHKLKNRDEGRDR
jgi:hypothetical protein